MVFPSNPVYLDPPHWHQQQPNQVIPQGLSSSATTNDQNNQHLPPLPPLPPPQSNPGLVRPGSMAEKARLAKIPQPEPALKCPRCESTNTKFCYFNNYSLSQPRHFCKTCRRYWTRGGALRNVPVGGGCRRNKKNKTNPSSSKASSHVSNERSSLGGIQVDISSSSSLSSVLNNNPSETIIGHLPFMSSLHNFTHQYGMGNLGLNFSGINNLGTTTSGSTSQTEMGFMGINGGGGGGMQQLQQFPFFESTPSSSLLYPFQSEVVEGQANATRVSRLGHQVKMEDNNHQGGVNLTSRPFMGVGDWTGNNTWSDLSNGGCGIGGAGLNSSASDHEHQHLHHHL